MKREIVCNRCVDQWRRIAKDPEVVAAGEQIHVTTGDARRTYLCDGCGSAIDRGQRSHAVTITTPRQRPYETWEHDAVAPEGVEP